VVRCQPIRLARIGRSADARSGDCAGANRLLAHCAIQYPKGGVVMPSYRVKFFKNLCNCYGRPFTVLQRAIAIRRSKDLHRAVEAAQRRF
jgi:hypothetical protein